MHNILYNTARYVMYLYYNYNHPIIQYYIIKEIALPSCQLDGRAWSVPRTIHLMKFLDFSTPLYPSLNLDRTFSKELGCLFLEFLVIFGGFLVYKSVLFCQLDPPIYLSKLIIIFLQVE